MTKDKGYERTARLYDLFAQTGDLEFYGKYALQEGRAIDIGAGTGRLAIPLAERGVQLVCVEPSEAMCREFREKLKKHPQLSERVAVIQADAVSFHVDETFPAAFMAGSFDFLITDRERRAALTNVAHHLHPGGRLTLDSYWGLMTDSPCRHADEVQVGERKYRRLVDRQVQPDDTVQISLIYEIYRGAELEDRIEQHSWAGVIERKRIHELLTEAGFKVIAEYRDYDLAPYRDGEQLLLIEAERMAKNRVQGFTIRPSSPPPGF